MDSRRRSTRLGAVLAASWLALAADVSAQTAEAPVWKVGDRWVYQQEVKPPPVNSRWSRTVEEALPDGRFKVRTGSDAFLEFDSHGNSLDKRGPGFSWRRFNFPLTVGKTWNHERKTAGETWSGIERSTWTVRAYEKVTVPAGTFDCFRVEGEAHSNWTSAQAVAQQWNRATTLTTYWYCPEVKWPANWVIENTAYLSAARTVTTSELVKFEPGP